MNPYNAKCSQCPEAIYGLNPAIHFLGWDERFEQKRLAFWY